MTNKKIALDDDDAYSVLPCGEYFPNGVPKVCFHYDMDGDIHVVKHGDQEFPILEDTWLALDLKKGLHIFHYWTFRAKGWWDFTGPRVWDFSTDYANSDVEASQIAVQNQEQLAREGSYVPIHVRD